MNNRIPLAVRLALLLVMLTLCPGAGAQTFGPDTWLLTGASPNAVAGERFEVLVVAPEGAVPPDEIELRLKSRGEERIVMLSATEPANGSRRTYAGTMPPGLSGPLAADLPGRASSSLGFTVAASRAEAAQAFVTRRDRAAIAEPPLSENDPMYFIVGPRGGWSSRFQLSFKYRLFDQGAGYGQEQPWLSGFYFGYTQNSLWDLSEDSRPFRDTSYKPSFFWKWERSDERSWLDALRFGLEHESNGGTDERSRSVNTVFARPEFRWSYADQSRLEFTPRFHAYFDKGDNPDIARYRGYADWRVRYETGHNWIGTAVARVGTAGYGSILLDVSRRIRDLKFGPVGGYLHFQYFNGYGEDILDYNTRRKWQFRVGFAIVP
jgi:phospholipase A1/A2